MLGAAGRQHRQIAVGESGLGIFINRVERIYQTITERIGVDVKRRMNEVRDIHPEILVSRTDVDRGSKALALHAKPDFADALGRQFAVAPFGVNGALERIERDLPDHRVDHVLDFAGKQRLALLAAPGLCQ